MQVLFLRNHERTVKLPEIVGRKFVLPMPSHSLAYYRPVFQAEPETVIFEEYDLQTVYKVSKLKIKLSILSHLKI